MKRQAASERAEIRKGAFRKAKRERERYVCCYRCEKHLPGHNTSDAPRTTLEAKALADQARNS